MGSFPAALKIGFDSFKIFAELSFSSKGKMKTYWLWNCEGFDKDLPPREENPVRE
jgi:hypothetical protein